MKENDPEFKRAFNAAEQAREIVSKITKARKEMGLTQKDFASMLGLKQQAISTFERVEESPSLKKLVQFADVLELFTLRKNNLAFYIIKACVFQ